MFRPTFQFAALLTALLFVPMLLIRAQPNNDRVLRAFLTPPSDCPAPCFMGIQPGVTTAGAALTLLEQHEWVHEVNIMETPISWTWSGRQPAWIDDRVPGHLVTDRFVSEVRDDAAVNVFFQSTLTLADVFMILGPPDQAWFGIHDPTRRISPAHHVYYEAYGLQLDTALRCPLRLDAVWRKPLEMNFVPVTVMMKRSDLPAPVFPAANVGWQRSSPIC